MKLQIHFCNLSIVLLQKHKENFLSGKGEWTFGYIQQGDYGDDVVGDITKGLKLKKVKIKSRNGTYDVVVYPLMSNVKTGSKKTDLK